MPVYLLRFHSPRVSAACAGLMWRAAASIRATASSAALVMLEVGALTTSTPFCVAALTSTLSSPTPARATTLRRGAAARASSSILVAERTRTASASLDRGQQVHAVGAVAVPDLEVGPRASTVAGLSSSAMRTTGRESVEFTTFLTLVMSLPARRCALASVTDRETDSPRRSAGEMSTEARTSRTTRSSGWLLDRGGGAGPGAGEGPSKYELLGPSVDRRTVTTDRSLSAQVPAAVIVLAAVGCPAVWTLCFQRSRSPRRECVGRFLRPRRAAPQGTLGPVCGRFLDAWRVVHRTGSVVHRNGLDPQERQVPVETFATARPVGPATPRDPGGRSGVESSGLPDVDGARLRRGSGP